MAAKKHLRDEYVRQRLERGASCTEIAAELGVSLRVVSGIALRLGFRSRSGPRKGYDWEAIRSYYESGHTARDCRDAFGFSPGAWDQAVLRGDIVPRPQRDPAKHSYATRRAVEERLAAGMTQAEISRELGLAKATVAFHVRNLGIEPDARFSRRYDWTEIQAAYDGGMSPKECRLRFGCSAASWTQAVRRGELNVRPRKTPLEELCVAGTKRGRWYLKQRLIEEGVKEDRCEQCGISEWRGRPLPAQLHHVNGDQLDNRIENLSLLCANCHSLTENWGGRNKRAA